MPSNYREPSCEFTHAPSNTPHHGFHPIDELLLGDPDLPRSYEFSGRSQEYVDSHQFTSWNRGDMTMRFTYDSVVEHEFGGELCTFPIVLHVYRRDFSLKWEEIRTFFRTGETVVPLRYGPRVQNGVVHEPMNEATFRRIAKRFAYPAFPTDPLFDVDGAEYLVERATGRACQDRHMEFEALLTARFPFQHRILHLVAMDPEALAELAAKHYNTWYLDAVPRSISLQRWWRMTWMHHF
uniref:Uncharacterized protein n=1 Tax=Mycena chlorophos TaxID=658473 RepID=A0ABQ0L5T8_MYCCL|nr:predicted protein [Mycena chlorophos]